MNIEFDSTPDKLIQACAAGNRLLRDRLYKRSWLAVPYYGAIALWAVSFVSLASHSMAGRFVPPATIWISLGLLLAGAGLLILATSFSRRRMLDLLTREASAIFGPCSVAFDDKKLSYTDPRGRVEIPWKLVDTVEDMNSNIVILYGVMYVIQIPGDAFPDMDARREFREEVKKRMMAARGNASPVI